MFCSPTSQALFGVAPLPDPPLVLNHLPRKTAVMGNHALDLNPPQADLHLSTNGSDWLWAAFSFITLSLLATIVLDFMVCVAD